MKLAKLAGAAIRPPPRLSVAEWADRYRILPDTSAEPGPWRTSRTPYLREPLEALTPGSGVRTLVMMSSAQVGKTELLLNAIGHMMMVDPGPSLVVQATKEVSREWSQMRLKPMIDATPELADMFGDSQRNEDNKTSHKGFPGGFLVVAYPSTAQLSSKPIRYAYGDEIDRWAGNVGGEGDPVKLLRARTTTFSDRKREVFVSTPTKKNYSRIEKLFLGGDQRRYHVPCPHCDALFVLRYEQLTEFDGLVYVECPECNVYIGEEHKGQMLRDGEWIPGNPNASPAVRSYHMSGLYSPPGWLSWKDVYTQVEEAFESKDRFQIQAVVNTVLGEAYEDEQMEAADWEKLHGRAGRYAIGTPPIDVGVLTAGVDVQGNRLEVEIVGWGVGMRSWSIDYIVLPGDPRDREIWDDLTKVLNRVYIGEQGAKYRISQMAIDTGYLTNHVYQWCRRQGRRRVMPVKGSTQQSVMMRAPTAQDVAVDGHKIAGGVHLWSINVDMVKDHVVKWLKLGFPDRDAGGELRMPERWCEFPAYHEEYFKGLCGEQLVDVNGRLEWKVVYYDQEPFDCRVYATAAAFRMGIDRYRDETWVRILKEVRAASNLDEDPVAIQRVGAATKAEARDPPAARRKKRRYTDSNYLKSR